MEYTTNELKLDNSYIINVTNVEMLPYTHRSFPPDKPTIVGLDKGEISFDVRTSFNILKTLELRYDEMVTQNTGLKDYEKEVTRNNENVILIMRSGFSIQNMELLSEFEDLSVAYNFFFLVFIQERWVAFRDLHTSTSGIVCLTFDPGNIVIENVDVDYYRSKGGFAMEISCHYPEAYLDASVYADNITFHYKQERIVYPIIQSALRSEMPGNFTVSNLHSELFYTFTDETAVYALFPRINCVPDVDTIRYFTSTNISMPLDYENVQAHNIAFVQIDSDIYRESRIQLTNIN